MEINNAIIASRNDRGLCVVQSIAFNPLRLSHSGKHFRIVFTNFLQIQMIDKHNFLQIQMIYKHNFLQFFINGIS